MLIADEGFGIKLVSRLLDVLSASALGSITPNYLGLCLVNVASA